MVKKFFTSFLVNEKKQERYKRVYHSLPMAIIEFEFGPISDYINRLKREKVKDIRAHICDRHKEIRDLFRNLRLVNINPEALKLYEAPCRKAFSKKQRKHGYP